MRTLFVGSPGLAAQILTGLLDRVPELTIAEVWTQPDRPSGRGKRLQATAVATVAEKHNLELYKTGKIGDSEKQRLIQGRFDLAIVVAFGALIPEEHLNLPRLGWWNIHPSELPGYRGASPLASALRDGLTQTAVTLMLLDQGLDSGPLIARLPLRIEPQWRAPQLEEAVVAPAIELLREGAQKALDGNLSWRPQDNAKATYCPKIRKADGRITFATSAKEIYNCFRAFDPWPGIAFARDGEWIRILDCQSEKRPAHEPPGSLIVVENDDLIVACSEQSLRLRTLQRPGRKPVTGREITAGWRLKPGDPIELMGEEKHGA